MKKLIVFAAGLFFALSAFSESRNALLIANGKYKNFGNLATPVSEAKDLKKALEKLDFKVTLVENCNREKISDALYDFQTKLEKSGGIGFFHYGGHAVQVNGKNYLIPVDADIPDERRVASRAVDVDEVMASMQADTNIVILDACRNNPLPASSGRTATRGLVITEFKPKNSIIVYSAQPGKVAQDGIFTPILTEKLLEKKEFGAILRDVRNAVSTRTNGEQSPGEYNELITDVYLAGYNVQNPVTKDDVKQIEKNSSIDYVDLANKAYEEKNYKLAFEYFSKAEKITDSYSQGNLGWLYQTGEGGFQNYAKAFEWYMKSAKQGDAFSQNKVGIFYFNGYGVGQSYKNARTWYEKAAKQGNASAQCDLGYLYHYGLGVSQNAKKAYEWYEKSANQGDATAQYNIGVLYNLAVDGTSDANTAAEYKKQAKEWFEKAAAQGYEQAVEALKNFKEDEKIENVKTETKKIDVAKNETKKQADNSQTEQKASSAWLFPLYGCEIGKTTVKEMKKLGKKKWFEDYYIINGRNFYYNKYTKVFDHMYISRYNWISEWEKLGYSPSLSYNEWISLLKSQGYEVKIIEAPHVWQGSLYARLIAFRQTPIEHIIELDFRYSGCSNLTDKNTLFSFLISTDDFKIDYWESQENKEEEIISDESDEVSITRTETFFPLTSHPWTEDWTYTYNINDTGCFDEKSIEEWKNYYKKQNMNIAEVFETVINDETELQYATELLKTYSTVLVSCKGKEATYSGFRAIKLNGGRVIIFYFE